MKSQFLQVLVSLSLSVPSLAQISMPTNRIVFQRGNDNSASVPIAGRCGANQTVQAKVTPLNGGQMVDWTTIATNASNSFEGTIRVSGGWYRLDVRSSSGGYWTVDRFGVGEVFVTAGQSNSYGNNWDTGAAQDDRVSVADYWGGGGGNIAENELPTTFSQAGLKPGAPGNTVSAGPAAPLYLWGAFGDKIVQKTGVPVMILAAGMGATDSNSWRDAATGTQNVQTPHTTLTNNAPYRGLGVAILHYLKRTGVRAVLWHQGESDANRTSRQDYINNIQTVINKTRSQSGFSNLSWVVAKASYMPTQYSGLSAQTDPAIISAQEALAGMPNNWTGPYTDPYQYPQHRLDDGLHFARADCQFVAQLWADQLTPTFFSSVQPSLAARSPLLTTGYVLPMLVGGGASVNVPYMSTLPVGSDNQYRVDILTEGGTMLATVATGGGNPMGVTIPTWANGRYRLRVSATSPAYQGEPGETFTVTGSGSGVPDGSTPVVTPPPTVMPSLTTGTFALLAPTYNCSTKQFTFNSTGAAGQVLYWAVGITGRTTVAGQYIVNPAPDANAFSLSAQLVSGGAIVNYSWDWKAACNGSTPVTPPVLIPPVVVPPVTPTPVTPPPVVTPPPTVMPTLTTGTFALLAPTYNCSTKQFTFNSTGAAGQVLYWAVGVTGRTTVAGPFRVDPASDAERFTLNAQLVSGGAIVNYSWDWKAACGLERVARSGAETAINWLVYPNPTASTVRIESTLDGAEQVSIYSMTGQSLLTRMAVRFPLFLDLTNLPAGNYIIRVLNQKQQWNHPLIRQ